MTWRRVVWGVSLLVTMTVLGSCTDDAGDKPPALDAPAVRYQPPQYAAEAPGGVLVRGGSKSRILEHVLAGAWLADGRYLVQIGHRVPCAGGAPDWCGTRPAYVLDPESGTLTKVAKRMGLSNSIFMPTATPWGLSLLITDRNNILLRTTPDLSRRLPDLRLPAVDGEAWERSYGETLTIGDATYVEFSDIVADHSEEYGYLRVVDDEVDKVLVGQRIAQLWISSDGRSLLGTQQLHGEPCGGCIVEQDIVEIDPVSGEIIDNYGVPDGYDKWGVQALDKIDGRVAVRYGLGPPGKVQLWTTDGGDWTMDEASEDVPTWWQGSDDRIEVRPAPGRASRHEQLVWVHDGQETLLPGDGGGYPFDVAGCLLPCDL